MRKYVWTRWKIRSVWGERSWKDVWNELSTFTRCFRDTYTVYCFCDRLNADEFTLIAQSEHDFPCQGSLGHEKSIFDAKKTRKGTMICLANHHFYTSLIFWNKRESKIMAILGCCQDCYAVAKEFWVEWHIAKLLLGSCFKEYTFKPSGLFNVAYI